MSWVAGVLGLGENATLQHTCLLNYCGPEGANTLENGIAILFGPLLPIFLLVLFFAMSANGNWLVWADSRAHTTWPHWAVKWQLIFTYCEIGVAVAVAILMRTAFKGTQVAETPRPDEKCGSENGMPSWESLLVTLLFSALLLGIFDLHIYVRSPMTIVALVLISFILNIWGLAWVGMYFYYQILVGVFSGIAIALAFHFLVSKILNSRVNTRGA